MNNKILLEYIWIDLDNNLRSKIKIIQYISEIKIDNIPEWNFDGSSTGQAEGKDSDVLLKPVSIFLNPFYDYISSYIILCECYNKNNTPHDTNYRNKLLETYNKCKLDEPLFGIEQEYVIFDRKKKYNSHIDIDEFLPYKWIEHHEPGLGGQGPYYCSVGGGVCLGRKISDKHLEMCLKAGLSICGTNAEVMASQWEYQIGPLSPIEVSDQLWVSRFILNKISEDFECIISYHPKPYKGNWNGSGGHTNFSTIKMREGCKDSGNNGLKFIEDACIKLEKTHNLHMQVYGKYNEERLTGNHETSSINDFSWGISNRGKSIRIPLNVANEKYGYLEDRRPGSNLDPYLVTEIICKSICL